MVNCNPETVSTDYDTSDRLYFEPLTTEDVLEIIETEKAAGEVLGLIVQFGGQTPLKLAQPLADEGAPILGTSVDAIDLAEDRDRFQALLHKIGLKQPENTIAALARSSARRCAHASAIRWCCAPPTCSAASPWRSSHDEERATDAHYVQLGGRRARVSEKRRCWSIAICATPSKSMSTRSATARTCSSPASWSTSRKPACIPATAPARCRPIRSRRRLIAEIEAQTKKLALALDVRGLINIQFAVKDGEIYVLEANPRASRTVPFVAKAIGLPIAAIAAKVMAGAKLKDLKLDARRSARTSR